MQCEHSGLVILGLLIVITVQWAADLCEAEEEAQAAHVAEHLARVCLDLLCARRARVVGVAGLQHTHTDTYTHRYTETHTHTHTQRHTQIHRDTPTHTHTHTHIYRNRHIHWHASIDTYTHTHAQIDTHTYTDTHTGFTVRTWEIQRPTSHL